MDYKITLPILRSSSDGPSPNIRIDWCCDNFGERGTNWHIEIFNNNGNSFAGEITYCFDREEDLLLFSLRWAGIKL